MENVLIRIKRAILAGRYRFSMKARDEMDRDHLDAEDILESIVSASSIQKVIRSTSHFRKEHREMLYIIVSPTFTGLLIYTKGKLEREAGEEVYYFLISSKRAL
jgi:hypothetical protein